MSESSVEFEYPKDEDEIDESEAYRKGLRDGFSAGLRFCIDWILYGNLGGAATRAMVLFKYGYTVLWDSPKEGVVRIRAAKRKDIHTAKQKFKVFILQWVKKNPGLLGDRNE